MKRLAYAVLALALLGLLVFLVARHDTGWWRPVAFGLGPDVALVLGIGYGLARSQLHPRAVRTLGYGLRTREGFQRDAR
jgi:hypothetical protein